MTPPRVIVTCDAMRAADCDDPSPPWTSRGAALIRRTCGWGTALGLLIASTARAQPASDSAANVSLAPLVVSVTRAPQPAAHVPVTVETLTASDFANSGSLTIDDVLKQSAAFSLFRRTGSLMANPTAQGVSLRNLGPSGAGRTLVLLDGVPLNDPFGGWIAWSKLPRLSLGAAEIVRGGGSSAWGSAALGGTVHLLTAPPEPTGSAGAWLIGAGNARTASAEAALSAADGANVWSIGAKAFTTDGFWRVSADRRGAIDRRTDSNHRWLSGSWRHQRPNGTTTTVSARWYDEDRGNGTPLQRNQTREGFVSAQANGRWADDRHWSATVYYQTQEFSNVFSAVAADRATETPSLDQFAVPADAAGLSTTGSWRSDISTTTVGGDVRWVRGETQEAFLLQNGVFTRRRFAGGEQTFIGGFAQHERALADRVRLSAGVRVDYWANRGGHRREQELNGMILRNEHFATRDGLEVSPSLGLVWQARDAVRVRTAAYRAFRVPTLNELYRPFRVGNTITEANPRLRNETLTGAEAGVEVAVGRATVAATAFWNELSDAVANVTLGAGPGNVPGVGFVPAGGFGRQRRNLDRIEVHGFELTARTPLGQRWEVRVDYLWSDATVERASGPAAELIGRRLAQVPRQTLVAGLARHAGPWRISTQVRHVSTAFEDDLNTLPLAPATTVDARLAYRFGPARAGEIALVAENLFDETIEAGREADGRIDRGQPRFVHGSLRWRW